MTDLTTVRVRVPNSIESGFIAAGVTISGIAGMQTLAILLRWIFAGI